MATFEERLYVIERGRLSGRWGIRALFKSICSLTNVENGGRQMEHCRRRAHTSMGGGVLRCFHTQQWHWKALNIGAGLNTLIWMSDPGPRVPFHWQTVKGATAIRRYENNRAPDEILLEEPLQQWRCLHSDPVRADQLCFWHQTTNWGTFSVPLPHMCKLSLRVEARSSTNIKCTQTNVHVRRAHRGAPAAPTRLQDSTLLAGVSATV